MPLTNGDQMDSRYDKMVRRVGLAFYRDYLPEVRDAVRNDEIDSLIQKANGERPDIITAGFRIRAIASAFRQGYDL